MLDVEKRWRMFADLNGNGVVNPGDTLLYTVYVSNIGSAPATDVWFNDAIPVNTTLVPGSVSASQGVVVTQAPVSVNIGTVNPGDVVTIAFRVTVDGGTADGTVIANQGVVSC